MNELEKIMYAGANAQYEKIAGMDVGTDEYVKAINGAGNVVDRLNEMRKIRLEEAKIELEKKKAQLEERKLAVDERTRWVQAGTDIGKFVASAAIFVGIGILTMGFEMGNTQCTKIGQDAQKKLFSMFNIKV